MKEKIKVAIIGVGNCASSLCQGISYYGQYNNTDGLFHRDIGEWSCGDIEVVCAFDVDYRKVGLPLNDALRVNPNCAMEFIKLKTGDGPIVQMGHVLDGIAEHMNTYPAENSFRVANKQPVDIVKHLVEANVDVVVNYLPVGSEEATEYYAGACLEAGCAMVNCVPCFVASDIEWSKRFEKHGLPIIGDDIKSQLGATILHRAVGRVFSDRGINIKHTYQLNTGGNTDFLNMRATNRLESKKLSKTQSVQAELNVPLAKSEIHVGPSDYVPWLKDNKVAFIRMEGEGFGGAPVELEMRLSVQDSPNSAGIVVDAIRCAALAKKRGIGGPINEACSVFMKSPPRQVSDQIALAELEDFINQPLQSCLNIND